MNFKILIHNFSIRILPKNFYFLLKGLYNKCFKKKIIKNWELSGKPLPPPHQVKQEIIKYYQNKFGYTVLVETGTLWGDMIEAQQNSFKKIYSIELSNYFYTVASKRFKNKQNVKIYNGDSSILLPEILKTITEPIIFWLDGHYSGGKTAKGSLETPILAELRNIFNQSRLNHVILIDDARCFNGRNEYPDLKEIEKFINELNIYNLKIENDIIQIFPL